MIFCFYSDFLLCWCQLWSDVVGKSRVEQCCWWTHHRHSHSQHHQWSGSSCRVYHDEPSHHQHTLPCPELSPTECFRECSLGAAAGNIPQFSYHLPLQHWMLWTPGTRSQPPATNCQSQKIFLIWMQNYFGCKNYYRPYLLIAYLSHYYCARSCLVHLNWTLTINCLIPSNPLWSNSRDKFQSFYIYIAEVSDVNCWYVVLYMHYNILFNIER